MGANVYDIRKRVRMCECKQCSNSIRTIGHSRERRHVIVEREMRYSAPPTAADVHTEASACHHAVTPPLGEVGMRVMLPLKGKK